MKHSMQVGFSFGLTSAIITSIGLIVGLHASTNSELAVIGGIITIAVADALSDALGIHISEEFENVHTPKEVWIATISTFLTKFVVAASFLAPILLLSLGTAVIICIIWGMLLLGIFSWFIGKAQGTNKWSVITEHLTIAVVVILLTHYLGIWIEHTFS